MRNNNNTINLMVTHRAVCS